MTEYMVVEVPVLSSPCRKCQKGPSCSDRTKRKCKLLKSFRKTLDGEFTGFRDPELQGLYMLDPIGEEEDLRSKVEIKPPREVELPPPPPVKGATTPVKPVVPSAHHFQL